MILKRFLNEKGGGLYRYLQSKRSGIRAESNIFQIVKNFMDFAVWYKGKNDHEIRQMDDVNEFLEHLITEEFMFIRQYSDSLCESEDYKAASVKSIVINISHCLKWFAVYVLRDANKLLSGIHFVVIYEL